jgi:hypothetical protein
VTVGLGGAQTDCEGVLGRNSLAPGTGPIDSSSLVAQSSRACLRGTGLTGVLSVVDGARSCTSSWISFIASCSPVFASRRSFSRSLAPSSFSTPFPSFSLLTSGSSLYCCSIFVMALFESVAVVVVVSWIAGVAVLTGAEMVVVVVLAVFVTCCMSTAGSAGCDGGIVSVSRSSSEARNFAIAFRTRLGNGPDRVCAQFSSIRASCVSIFSTVFISSSVSADDVAGLLLVTAREVVVVVVVPILLAVGLVAARAFLAAFFQMSSMMTVREIVSNG